MALRLGSLIGALASLPLLAAGAARSAEAPELLLATTTSVRDSGLLAELLPPFTARTGIRVKLIAVGSGAALEMARRGDADVVIAGPPEDPARVKGAASAVQAIERIAAARAPFATRGDESGTHQRERKLFEQAGLGEGPTWPGVLRTGAGMGQTLQVAGEKRAYLLCDEATFRAFRARVDLVALTGPDPALRNLYSVSLVPPARFEPGRIHAAEARALAAYLVEPATLERIGRFGAEAGEPLFRPLP